MRQHKLSFDLLENAHHDECPMSRIEDGRDCNCGFSHYLKIIQKEKAMEKKPLEYWCNRCEMPFFPPRKKQHEGHDVIVAREMGTHTPTKAGEDRRMNAKPKSLHDLLIAYAHQVNNPKANKHELTCIFVTRIKKMMEKSDPKGDSLR